MIRSPQPPRPSAAPSAEAGTRAVPPPFADPAAGGVDREFDRTSRRWMSALNLLAVFTVGTGAGIAAAWWMIDRPAEVVMQAPPAVEDSVAPVQSPLPDQPAAATSVPSDELPYDGVAIDGDDAAFVPRIPYRIEPLPESAAASSGGDASKAAPDAPDDQPEGRVSGNEARKANEPKAVTRESAPEKARAAEKSEAKPDAAARSARMTARSAEKTPVKTAARAKPKNSAPKRPAQSDDEIQRILQQATDELWRKSVRERMPGDSSARDWQDPALPPDAAHA